MRDLKNISFGIDKIAEIYIERNMDPESKPYVHYRAGTNNSIKLKRYKMKDGSVSEEFVQMIMTNQKGQNLYFLGLKTVKRNFGWPAKKMLKRVKEDLNLM